MRIIAFTLPSFPQQLAHLPSRIVMARFNSLKS